MDTQRNRKKSGDGERERQRKKYRKIRSRAKQHYDTGAGKPPLPYCGSAPTPSLTNGERADNSDESESMRTGFAGGRQRSREGSRERSPIGEPEYGVIRTQPRARVVKRPIPRRHTVGGRTLNGPDTGETLQETERSKEAFMDMLASRYPQYAEKISSTASEDGFPVRGRSRDPRRRATVVSYNPPHNRSLDYDDVGTMSEVDAPTFHRGGYVRSSLPAARTPTAAEQPLGLVFLIFRDETKKALLPNEVTHLDTVRALFVRSFAGKLTMSFLESPKRKIYILDPRTNIYYQLEDLRDIKDRTVLRVHETDSVEPQRVADRPEVRGRTLQIHSSNIQGIYGSMPSSAITSQVHKAQPGVQSPYVSHDEINKSPSRSNYGDRSRSLTPDPARMASYAQNPIYGRMGISPERPAPTQERSAPVDRQQPHHLLRTIPENRQMINGNQNNNGYENFVDGVQYHQAPGAPSPVPGPSHPRPRQAMSPPPVPTGPRVADPGRRAMSPPPNLQHYDYIQVVPGSQSAPGAPTGGTYVAKGVRAATVVSPQRATGAPTPIASPQPTPPPPPNWRERSPVGRQFLPLSSAPYSGTGAPNTAQRTQSYRVTPTAERDSVFLPPPRSLTPQPVDGETRNRIDKMELQLASLAAWVQTAVVQTGSGSTGAPSSVKSTSTTSVTSESASPVVESASSNIESDKPDGIMGEKGLTDIASDDTAIVLSQDMRNKILAIKKQADDLRLELQSLRRLQQINKESIIETVDDAWRKIRKALASVPGAERLLVRQQRNDVDEMFKIYMEDKAKAERELGDLEAAVEELRSDVLARQCRVNMSDVEGMALVLSHITKALGSLKVRFPQLQEQMKMVMAAEMEVVVQEERFLVEEGDKLDVSLKKCKKLTGTLFTLKRLASVQEHRPPQVPALTAQAKMPTREDKKAVLENIQAMIPNHDARVQSMQAAETSRQRKKKITTQQEALRFGKSLELASKALKPMSAFVATRPAEASAAPAGAKSPETYHPASCQSVSKTMSGDTSSILSFAAPMSTSTPKSGGSGGTPSCKDVSSTSPSIAYPVVSLIRAVSPRRDGGRRDPRESESGGSRGGSGDRPQRPTSSTEPAVIPVTSNKTVSVLQLGAPRSSKTVTSDSSKPVQPLSNQKSEARAAFFSSLASPVTPTTTSPIVCGPSTRSPTESYSRIPPSRVHVSVSQLKTVPSLIHSSARSSTSSSAGHSRASSSSLATKPSSLPVSSTSSIVSSQKFSPASPTGSSTGSKPRTAFSAIPKPYSPSSPVTPESPKYRVPPSQMLRDAGKAMSTSQKDSTTKSKKVPPPPPPRKSSKVPGHAVLAVNAATVNGTLTYGKHHPESRGEKGGAVRRGERTREVTDVDVIEPPKAFATPELESSKGSSTGASVITSKKISRSNLNSGEKVLKFEKDIEVCTDRGCDDTDSVAKGKAEKDPAEGSAEGDDFKVSNINTSPKHSCSREGSIDSTSSSSSIDSQQEAVWMKRKDIPSKTAPKDDISVSTSEPVTISTSTSASLPPSQSVSMPTSASVSIATSVPVASGLLQIATKLDQPEAEHAKDDANVASAGVAMTTSADGKSDGKKQKPAPPERRSSLSSKSQTESDQPSSLEKTKSKKETK